MSDPFVGEIKMFAGTFAPLNYAFCNGALMSIQQNTTLFSLLGTTYGGNGQTTFALPDLTGRAAMQPGTGVGLTPRDLGESSGENSVVLLESQLPAHSHDPGCVAGVGTESTTTGSTWAGTGRTGAMVYSNNTPTVRMSPMALGLAGSSVSHNNVQPCLAINFIIALEGIFPMRG